MDDDTLTTATGFEAAPALVAGIRDALWLSRDGEIETLSHRETHARIRDGVRPIVCHSRLTAETIRAGTFQGFDILELFAFVRPAVFCLPTPSGVAQSLLSEDADMAPPHAPRGCNDASGALNASSAACKHCMGRCRASVPDLDSICPRAVNAPRRCEARPPAA